MYKMPTIENGIFHNLPTILEDLTHEMVQVNPSTPRKKKGVSWVLSGENQV